MPPKFHRHLVFMGIFLVFGAFGWWAWKQITQSPSDTAASASRFRIQLLDASGKALKRDLALAKADRDDGAKEGLLRELAEADYGYRLTRIQKLTDSLARQDSDSENSAVLIEMFRLVKESSIDAALAHLEKRRPEILQAYQKNQPSPQGSSKPFFAPDSWR